MHTSLLILCDILVFEQYFENDTIIAERYIDISSNDILRADQDTGSADNKTPWRKNEDYNENVDNLEDSTGLLQEDAREEVDNDHLRSWVKWVNFYGLWTTIWLWF